MKEEVKLRFTMGLTAARRATAKAVRWMNIVRAIAVYFCAGAGLIEVAE
jgi:hypothetical protein